MMSSDINRELRPDEMADTIGLPQGRFSRREIQIQLAKAQVERGRSRAAAKSTLGLAGVLLVVSILPGAPESMIWIQKLCINMFYIALALGVFHACEWIRHKAEIIFWEPLWQAGGTAFNLNNLREQTVSYYQNLPK